MNATVYRHRNSTNNATYLITDHDGLGALFLADGIDKIDAQDTIIDSVDDACAELDADDDWAHDETAEVQLYDATDCLVLIVLSETHADRSVMIMPPKDDE